MIKIECIVDKNIFYTMPNFIFIDKNKNKIIFSFTDNTTESFIYDKFSLEKIDYYDSKKHENLYCFLSDRNFFYIYFVCKNIYDIKILKNIILKSKLNIFKNFKINKE